MAHALNYDTLPTHSAIRREIADNGDLTLLVDAEEPSALVRRAALRSTAIHSALICVVIHVAGCVVFLPIVEVQRRLLPLVWDVILVVSISAFGCALFLLVWRVRYAWRIDDLTHVLDRSTALVVARGQVLVEENCGAEPRGHKILVDAVGRVDFRCTRWEGASLTCLEIVLPDGRSLQLLPGRDETEIKWIATELRLAVARMLQQEQGTTKEHN